MAGGLLPVWATALSDPFRAIAQVTAGSSTSGSLAAQSPVVALNGLPATAQGWPLIGLLGDIAGPSASGFFADQLSHFAGKQSPEDEAQPALRQCDPPPPAAVSSQKGQGQVKAGEKSPLGMTSRLGRAVPRLTIGKEVQAGGGDKPGAAGDEREQQPKSATKPTSGGSVASPTSPVAQARRDSNISAKVNCVSSNGVSSIVASCDSEIGKGPRTSSSSDGANSPLRSAAASAAASLRKMLLSKATQ